MKMFASSIFMRDSCLHFEIKDTHHPLLHPQRMVLLFFFFSFFLFLISIYKSIYVCMYVCISRTLFRLVNLLKKTPSREAFYKNQKKKKKRSFCFM